MDTRTAAYIIVECRHFIKGENFLKLQNVGSAFLYCKMLTNTVTERIQQFVREEAHGSRSAQIIVLC